MLERGTSPEDLRQRDQHQSDEYLLQIDETRKSFVYTLKPLIVVMAGENEFDPYKD